MSELKISTTLTLPLDAVTQRAALLAVSGAGKSNAARAMAEEFFAARLPFVAIDPKGDWWGLRAGRDGKPKGGLDVVIFGGEHADIPLERGGGTIVADAIVDQRLSCVVDLSGFESESDRKVFLFDFAKRLYHRNRDPLHLFFEECDEYLPQKPFKDETRLLRVFENIVRRGRTKGLGITLITQRSACVNKNVLTQVETLYALRTTGPQDLAAIEAWMKHHGAAREVLASLATLEDGEAWVWSPHFLKKTERFRFRKSHTFDSGATPTNHTAGSRRAPATLADVDVAGLSEKMAATIERATADDPKVLRKRIAELQKQVAAERPGDPKAIEERDKTIRAQALEIGDLQTSARKLERQIEEERQLHANNTRGILHTVKSRISEVFNEEIAGVQKWYGGLPKTNGAAARVSSTATASATATAPAAAPADRGRPPPRRTAEAGDGSLGKCARALLGALIQHGDLSLHQAAIIARYSPSSGGVRNAAGELRSLGLVDGANDALTVTAQGRAHPATRGLEPLPVGPALAAFWLSQLGKCEASLLQQVLESYPRPVSLAEAAVASGYEPSSGGVRNGAGRLRTLMLINGTNSAMTANERLVS